MDLTHRILIVILLALLIVQGCTTRREYVSAANIAPVSSDAININTATREELQRLPHVGPKTAENIITFRQENGPFRRIEHLMQIRGVSEKRFLGMRPYLRIE